MEVDFLPVAEQELFDISEYYESKAENLGYKFLDQVERSLASIKENPKAWQKISINVHRCLVNRFPYSLLYVIEDQRILVIAVMPSRRKPKYWKSRLASL